MALSSAGAIPHLVRLARVHDPETQRHAARALGNLAANAACQKEIGQCGGLRPLIKCGYARSPELQQLGAQSVSDRLERGSVHAWQGVNGGVSQLAVGGKREGLHGMQWESCLESADRRLNPRVAVVRLRASLAAGEGLGWRQYALRQQMSVRQEEERREQAC